LTKARRNNELHKKRETRTKQNDDISLLQNEREREDSSFKFVSCTKHQA